VVDTSYRPKAYRFITRQVELGRQAYVICPMVEESEGLDRADMKLASLIINHPSLLKI
jgi:ATP-dependent DNA helicase RecG